MTATGWGQTFPHATQQCKKCGKRIFFRARSTNQLDGLDRPLPDEKWCEGGCPGDVSGAYD